MSFRIIFEEKMHMRKHYRGKKYMVHSMKNTNLSSVAAAEPTSVRWICARRRHAKHEQPNMQSDHNACMDHGCVSRSLVYFSARGISLITWTTAFFFRTTRTTAAADWVEWALSKYG
jgi:hypothetical protein